MRGLFSLLTIFLCSFSLLLVTESAFAVDLNISITVPSTSTPVDAGRGGNRDTAPRATVLMAGLAYPDAILTFLRNGAVIGAEVVDNNGRFSRSFSVEPGLATYGVWARDRYGLLSPTISISIDVAENAQANITSLALPPTIAHEQISADGSLTIFGSAFPGSAVHVFNNISSFVLPQAVAANYRGEWEYVLDKAGFNPRNFSYKANYQYEEEGIISPFSSNLELKLLACLNSDYNQDGQVNITDLSILLYYWGRPRSTTPFSNGCVDRNQDQAIDLRDFSILMYEWTAKYELQ